MILGVKEQGSGGDRRYVLSGWRAEAEPKLKEFRTLFTDRNLVGQDLSDCFPPEQLRDIPGGRVAVIYVDELSADRKFVFYEGAAYQRIFTGDHKLSEDAVEAQEEFKLAAVNARELQPVPGLTIADLDLARLNQFIFQLNQPTPIETMKSDLAVARPFLERRNFLRADTVTVLGALVCAKYPGDYLGFRSHVHGYVDASNLSSADERESMPIVDDKQDYVDNVLQLMEASLGYLLRNIRVGITAEHGGTSHPQYPTALLREMVNNALTHRDYALDRQVILTINPGIQLTICNPGAFKPTLLIESLDGVPVRRIVPEAKPRNPKLADILRVFRKWEGRGIGMATLVNLCLENRIDVPYYRLLSEEVCLCLPTGKLLDQRMLKLFGSFDRYIAEKFGDNEFTTEHKRVLAYVIKSEWANEKLRYTILLTADNNHFGALIALEKAGLIAHHPASSAVRPVYIADRGLMRTDYYPELRTIFGNELTGLSPLMKRILSTVYQFNQHSAAETVSAKRTTYSLWYGAEQRSPSLESLDAFYREVRRAFAKLENLELVQRDVTTRKYRLATRARPSV